MSSQRKNRVLHGGPTVSPHRILEQKIEHAQLREAIRDGRNIEEIEETRNIRRKAKTLGRLYKETLQSGELDDLEEQPGVGQELVPYVEEVEPEDNVRSYGSFTLNVMPNNNFVISVGDYTFTRDYPIGSMKMLEKLFLKWDGRRDATFPGTTGYLEFNKVVPSLGCNPEVYNWDDKGNDVERKENFGLCNFNWVLDIVKGKEINIEAYRKKKNGSFGNTKGALAAIGVDYERLLEEANKVALAPQTTVYAETPQTIDAETPQTVYADTPSSSSSQPIVEELTGTGIGRSRPSGMRIIKPTFKPSVNNAWPVSKTQKKKLRRIGNGSTMLK